MAEVAAAAAAASTATVDIQPNTSTFAASRPYTSSSAPSKEPAALATTKRKFHKLLEGLSKGPSKSVSSDSAAKRIRLEARSRLESANQPRSSSRDSIIQTQLLSTRLAAAGRNSTHRKESKTAPPVASDSTESLPLPTSKYVPWSHAHFLARLQTFADLRQWTSKPDAVNEVQWSKRGWVCAGVNTVACKGGCEQRVVVALRPSRNDADGNVIEDSEDYGVEVNADVVDKFKKLIIDGHDIGCLWYGTGCKDDIHRLPLARPEKWQPELKQRYKSFSQLEPGSLPEPDRLVNPLDMELMLNSLETEFFRNGNATSETHEQAEPVTAAINPSALALALTGWTASESSSATYPLATCRACFRRLGLWLYTSPAQHDSAHMKLDLLGNHRDYCPWTDPASQCGAASFAGLAGWEILQRVVANYASFRGHDAAHATQQTPHLVRAAATDADAKSQVPSPPKDRDKEDKARFARLKDLTKSMGFKSLKSKLLPSAQAHATK